MLGCEAWWDTMSHVLDSLMDWHQGRRHLTEAVILWELYHGNLGETSTPPPGPKLGKWVASAKEGISDSLSSGESFWEEVWRVEGLNTKRCHNLPRLQDTIRVLPISLGPSYSSICQWLPPQSTYSSLPKVFYGSRKVLPLPPYPGQTAWVGGLMSPESTFKVMKGDDGYMPPVALSPDRPL